VKTHKTNLSDMLKNPKIIVGSVILAAVLIWLAFTAQEWGNNADWIR
jgi:hypothetical protein